MAAKGWGQERIDAETSNPLTPFLASKLTRLIYRSAFEEVLVGKDAKLTLFASDALRHPHGTATSEIDRICNGAVGRTLTLAQAKTLTRLLLAKIPSRSGSAFS
jgi:hypothetical protein